MDSMDRAKIIQQLETGIVDVITYDNSKHDPPRAWCAIALSFLLESQSIESNTPVTDSLWYGPCHQAAAAASNALSQSFAPRRYVVRFEELERVHDRKPTTPIATFIVTLEEEGL